MHDVADQEKRELLDRVEIQRATILMYGWHLRKCDIYEDPEAPCSCGWDKVRARNESPYREVK